MSSDRKKITVAAFRIFPPYTGGQLRVFHIYRHLAKWFDIELVTYTHPGKEFFRKEISPGLWEIRVPKSKQHMEEEAALSQKAKVAVSDIGVMKFYDLSPEYLAALKQSAMTSEAVIACHPYIFPAIEAIGAKKIWYEAQDVEYELKQRILAESPLKDVLLEEIKTIEKQCCERSELIMTCSMDDSGTLVRLYNVDQRKIIEVPNGTDIEAIDFISPKKRIAALSEESAHIFTAVFVGSWHGPNLIAVENIARMAEDFPEIRFIVIGSAGKFLEGKSLPDNIRIMGFIDNDEKNDIMLKADLALNPMPYGSGTNLKMLEYLAYGIPVISTEIGVRGIPVENGKHVIICEMDNFNEAIVRFKNMDIEARIQIAANARRFVEEEFDWGSIAKRAAETIGARGLIEGPLRERTISDNKKLAYGYMPSEEFEAIMKKLFNKEIYIWGAGSGGQNCLTMLNKLKLNVKGFIDGGSQKWGEEIDGLIINPPQILTENASDQKRPFVIIASIYAFEIKKQLEEMGYKNRQDYMEQDVDVAFLYLT